MNCFTERIILPKDRPCRILLVHTILANLNTAPDAAAKLERLLERTEPDFLLLNGDITAEMTDTDTLAACLRVLLAPVTARNLPWAHTFGDKDRINALDGEEQLAVYRQIPGCITTAGEEDFSGCGNYVIPFCHGKTDMPAFLLWCMDTHDHVEKYQRDFGSPTRARLANPLYTQYYNDGIRFNQTMWYHRTARELEKTCGRKIPGIMCFHIPTPEHSLIPMNQYRTGMRGIFAEEVSCQTVNGGIFSAVFEHRDVQAVFCGNSRHNDFSGTYGGITLAQTASFRDTGKAALLMVDPEAEQICTWYTV
ncbi:MAG: hypothetical protein IKY52_07150 [Clostridia bacterium]|nr:hypothetical protein [Clostridia bacterium]